VSVAVPKAEVAHRCFKSGPLINVVETCFAEKNGFTQRLPTFFCSNPKYLDKNGFDRYLACVVQVFWFLGSFEGTTHSGDSKGGGLGGPWPPSFFLHFVFKFVWLTY